MNLKENLHKVFLNKETEIREWFSKQEVPEEYPFYCSFDIRESCKKIAPVDANLFPAGFNNICQDDRDAMVDILGKCSHIKGKGYKKLGLFCEEHTSNPYYWDNIGALITLFEKNDFDVFVLLPEKKPKIKSLVSASGREIFIDSIEIKERQVYIERAGEQSVLDLIISNNDYSSASESWIKDIDTPNFPPRFMGWHKRRKEKFFDFYNEVVADFSEIVGLDPFTFQVQTQKMEGFNVDDKESLEKLKNKVSFMDAELRQAYQKRQMDYEPHFFIKNSYGTYGLGVIEVKKPEDILTWNYKSRKKMKATKGGGGVTSVIIQEGIPTALKVNEAPAEAVIYLLGCGLAGGFVRTNERKGDKDSLNAPGAIFKRMCFSDYEFQKENKLLENVYGTVARLGALALSREIQAAQLELG